MKKETQKSMNNNIENKNDDDSVNVNDLFFEYENLKYKEFNQLNMEFDALENVNVLSSIKSNSASFNSNQILNNDNNINPQTNNNVLIDSNYYEDNQNYDNSNHFNTNTINLGK